MPPKNILDIRLRAAKNQVNNLENFATEPQGVFETIDDSVKTFRKANKETLREIGISEILR